MKERSPVSRARSFAGKLLDGCLVSIWVFSYAVLRWGFELLRLVESRPEVARERTSCCRETEQSR